MINSSNTTQFSKELEALRTAYLSALPAKVNLAQKAWLDMDIKNWDAQRFKNVYRLFHNIAGGAGTYGLAKISAQVRGVLKDMKAILEEKQAPVEGTYQEISRAVGILEDVTHDEIHKNEHKTHYLRKKTHWNKVVSPVVGNIFLVEDDLPQSKYLSLMLKRAGHHVKVFNSLEEVEAALETSDPVAILMDMVFPEGELAGAQAIARIQEKKAMPTPIIFISSRTDLEARLSAVRVGAWHYFKKPVRMCSLIQVLDTYLNPESEKKKRVLLIDDEPEISTFFAAHLEKEENLETAILNDPDRVLDVLDELKPDLILMDYWMPGCNGLELGAVIRQHETYGDIPIIFLTEETNLETQLTAMSLGSDDFLAKAMGPERLVLAVQSRLERIDQLRQAGAEAAEWPVN